MPRAGRRRRLVRRLRPARVRAARPLAVEVGSVVPGRRWWPPASSRCGCRRGRGRRAGDGRVRVVVPGVVAREVRMVLVRVVRGVRRVERRARRVRRERAVAAAVRVGRVARRRRRRAKVPVRGDGLVQNVRGVERVRPRARRDEGRSARGGKGVGRRRRAMMPSRDRVQEVVPGRDDRRGGRDVVVGQGEAARRMLVLGRARPAALPIPLLGRPLGRRRALAHELGRMAVRRALGDRAEQVVPLRDDARRRPAVRHARVVDARVPARALALPAPRTVDGAVLVARRRDGVDAERAARRALGPADQARQRGVGRPQRLAPARAQVALNEPARRRVARAVVRLGDERLEAAAQLGPLVRVVAELGVGEERVQDAQVRVLELQTFVKESQRD